MPTQCTETSTLSKSAAKLGRKQCVNDITIKIFIDIDAQSHEQCLTLFLVKIELFIGFSSYQKLQLHKKCL